MLRIRHRLWLGILPILLPWTNILAADIEQAATVTKFFGKAQIFSNPSEKKQGNPPHVLFEGRYYHSEPVKIGSKVELESVVQTSDKAMVRLVYPNGDQIMIASSTSYKTSQEKGLERDKPISELLYGKFRAIISKEGPRNKLEVRTRSMVMGIRGTDFFVSAMDDDGAASVSVLRGVVAVAQKTEAALAPSQKVEVKSGYSAKISPPPSAADSKEKTEPMHPKSAAGLSVTITDQQDLNMIRNSVSFKKADASSSMPDKSDPVLQGKLAMLEKQAVAATKADIKIGDPLLYKSIEAAEKSGHPIDNADILQAVTIQKALAKAPELNEERTEKLKKEELDKPQAKKPKVKAIEELDGDIYEKYFK